jgi:hypothetical protein
MRSALVCRSAASTVVLAIAAVTVGSAQSSKTDKIPPAPIIGLWPDYTYLPERQCNGHFSAEELNAYLPQARVAMWLPSTRSVALDSERQCLVVRVDDVDAGRMAELVIRGMGIPRKAVLLLIG